MIESGGVDIYDISNALGHSSLSVTQNYIREGFKRKRADEISETLARKFS